MRGINLLILFVWLSGALAQEFAPITINNWAYWQRGDGLLASSNNGQDPATLPQSKLPVLYTDGLVWAGKVQNPQDGEAALRAGGHYYISGTQAGTVVASNSGFQTSIPNQAHVYRIRRDWAVMSDDELRNDAAITFHKSIYEITAGDLDSLRRSYAYDWKNWPGAYGAPYYDRNKNGVWEAGIDEPGIASADQVIWYAYNDQDATKTRALFGSLPIGFEVHATIWAYKHSGGALSRTLFKRYEIWNISDQAVDSLYFGYFADFDAGDYADDLNGCNPTLNMGYTYNGRDSDELCNTWGLTPPALACILVQGPWVEAPGAAGIRNLQHTENIKNLPMTAFWHKAVGSGIWDPELGSYQGTLSLFAILQGYAQVFADGTLLPQYHGSGPQAGSATRFPVDGNPVTGSGDMDGSGQNMAAGSRRFTMCSGPVTLAAGQKQELVFALTSGETLSGYALQAVADLQKKASLLIDFYNELPDEPMPAPVQQTRMDTDQLPDANTFILYPAYPNPFNGVTIFNTEVLSPMQVQVAIYNIRGQLQKVLYNGNLDKGRHPFSWDGSNHRGQAAASGVYFLRVQNGPRMQWQKVVYLR